MGIWLIGARGAISTCVAYGLSGLRQGMLEPVGLATAQAPFDELPFAGFDELVLGGHDVCLRDVNQSAGELVASGVLNADLVAAGVSDAAAFDARIRPGLLDAPDVGMASLDPRSAELGSLGPREQIAQLHADWEAFEQETGVDRTVVVYVASTEAARDPQPEWDDLAEFESALDQQSPQPASVIYAYAALSSGRPFVNFTPSLGARIPALMRLAEQSGVPHCGNDAKTGETLLKTVLAPMFRARALKVLSWQGYNMLGNRDGEVLKDESHKKSKLENKDAALRSILGSDASLHTHVGIDFVPSLGDWKTAWDFVHFEGFLGARMSLQFTWAGSDSALAAPLVLDLARLAAFAAAAGEGGCMQHVGSFFKDPLGSNLHDFHAQHRVLLDYAIAHLERGRKGADQG
ncbi:MAG: myo-inositol-1-phosphate synthase [Chlamydiales bacterium]